MESKQGKTEKRGNGPEIQKKRRKYPAAGRKTKEKNEIGYTIESVNYKSSKFKSPYIYYCRVYLVIYHIVPLKIISAFPGKNRTKHHTNDHTKDHRNTTRRQITQPTKKAAAGFTLPI